MATAFVDGPTDDLVVGRRLTMVGRLAPSDTTSEVATIDVVRRSPTRPAAWWWEASERVRAGVRHAVAHTGRDPSALVPALVDGDDQRISDEVREEFRRSGLTHLLAVSGTNLTIVLAVVLVLARSLGVPRRVLVALGLVSVVGFVLLARPDPSVVRAAAMGVVGLAALGLGGRGGLRVLSVAIVALLFIDPWLSRSLGFVLSVCATAGILLAAPPLAAAGAMDAALVCSRRRRSDGGPARLHAGDRGDLGRGVAGCIFANLLAGPMVAPATVAGLVGGLLDLLSAPVARVPGTLAAWCAAWNCRVSHVSSWLAGAAIPWPAPWWVLIVLLPLVLAAMWRLAGIPRWSSGLRSAWGSPVATAAGGLATGRLGDGGLRRRSGRCHRRCPGDGSALLVDVGPEPFAVDRCLDRLRVDRLPVVAITHAHADHVDGWSGGVTGRDVGPSSSVRRAAHVTQMLRLTRSSPGTRFGVGRLWDRGPVAWSLQAGRSFRRDGDEQREHRARPVSTVARPLLLTGDVEPDAQDALLRRRPDLRPTS